MAIIGAISHVRTPSFLTDFVALVTGSLVVYACGDPRQPQVARYLADFGFNVIDVNKKAQADRAVGHRRLVDVMSVDPDRDHPMLFIAEDRCPKTIAEWKHLRYRPGMKNEYGESALEGEDHAFDAAKYFVMTRPEPTKEKQRPDWYREAMQQKRQEVRRRSMHNATRGLSRWANSGVSPYSRSA